MALGTGTELLLIHHYEDVWQLIPIILLSVSLIIFFIFLNTPNRTIPSLFKVLLIACIASGFLGSYFHLQANIEFALELNPSLSGWALLVKSFTGAFPALAPGSMIVFGLLGYLYTTLISKPKQ